MSRLSELALLLACITCLEAAASGVAPAEPALAEKPELPLPGATELVAVGRPAGSALKGQEGPATRGRASIRCWQEGRLIFESQGVVPVGGFAAAVQLQAGSRSTLQVLDLRQGLCVIESAQGS